MDLVNRASDGSGDGSKIVEFLWECRGRRRNSVYLLNRLVCTYYVCMD